MPFNLSLGLEESQGIPEEHIVGFCSVERKSPNRVARSDSATLDEMDDARGRKRGRGDDELSRERAPAEVVDGPRTVTCKGTWHLRNPHGSHMPPVRCFIAVIRSCATA